MFSTDDFSFYISIVTGLLLTISETLPYINSIKSNGILHLVTDTLLKRNSNNVSNADITDEENTRLLSNDVTNFIVNSSSVIFTFNSSKVKINFDGNEIEKSVDT